MWEYPHTVTFQKYVEESDGGGGYIKHWVDVFTTEAHVQPVSSRERISAMQVDAPVDHKIFYPYQKGVKTHMRAFWEDEDEHLTLQSNPLNQGGLGEVMMVQGALDG